MALGGGLYGPPKEDCVARRRRIVLPLGGRLWPQEEDYVARSRRIVWPAGVGLCGLQE